MPSIFFDIHMHYGCVVMNQARARVRLTQSMNIIIVTVSQYAKEVTNNRYGIPLTMAINYDTLPVDSHLFGTCTQLIFLLVSCFDPFVFFELPFSILP